MKIVLYSAERTGKRCGVTNVSSNLHIPPQGAYLATTSSYAVTCSARSSSASSKRHRVHTALFSFSNCLLSGLSTFTGLSFSARCYNQANNRLESCLRLCWFISSAGIRWWRRSHDIFFASVSPDTSPLFIFVYTERICFCTTGPNGAFAPYNFSAYCDMPTHSPAGCGALHFYSFPHQWEKFLDYT